MPGEKKLKGRAVMYALVGLNPKLDGLKVNPI